MESIFSFGEMLKKFRTRKRLTQQALATLVGVHRNHNLARDVIAVEHTGDFLTRLRFQAYERVDLVTLFAHDLRRGVEGNARIALNIDHARYLNVRRFCNRVFVPAQAILQIRLVRHGEYDHVALTLEFLR